MEKENGPFDADGHSVISDPEETRSRGQGGIKGSSRPPSHMAMRARSIDEEDLQSQASISTK